MGLASSDSKLSDLTEAAENISDRKAVSASVGIGQSYTVPRGYHNGLGKVVCSVNANDYILQEKSAEPARQSKEIVPDSGYYGLSKVTVGSVSAKYQDVSAVTAAADDVLSSKVIVGADGAVISGAMPNNGAVNAALDALSVGYTVPKGYHSGSGKVSVSLEEKSVTPTESALNVVPSTGKLLSKVTVNSIPSQYITTSDANATAEDITVGKTAYVNGVKLTGKLNPPVNSAFHGSMSTNAASKTVTFNTGLPEICEATVFWYGSYSHPGGSTFKSAAMYYNPANVMYSNCSSSEISISVSGSDITLTAKPPYYSGGSFSYSYVVFAW